MQTCWLAIMCYYTSTQTGHVQDIRTTKWAIKLHLDPAPCSYKLPSSVTRADPETLQKQISSHCNLQTSASQATEELASYSEAKSEERAEGSGV